MFHDSIVEWILETIQMTQNIHITTIRDGLKQRQIYV